MAYFIIWRFLYEVDLSFDCWSIGNYLGCGNENVKRIYGTDSIDCYRSVGIASAVFLAIALRQLPLGTAYAMWTGMGILGTTLLGVFLFHEKLSVPQVICVILIVVGIAGLKILINGALFFLMI